MPIKKDDAGNRSIEVEVEVPGSPEVVWDAIATAAGVSAWFVPTSCEYDDSGKPTSMTMNFGPGMDSFSKITAWNPPHNFGADSKDLGEDAPSIATQWIVEARDGNTCVVRVVHSLFTSSDEWDNQLQGWESGWPSFFRMLRMYLTHFPGWASASFQLTGFSGKSLSEAWADMFTALGAQPAAAGQRCETSGGVPPMGGVAEIVGMTGHPEELVLRLDAPTPGIAHLFVMPMGGQVLLSIRLYLYGDDAASVVARDEPLWQEWVKQHFPPIQTT